MDSEKFDKEKSDVLKEFKDSLNTGGAVRWQFVERAIKVLEDSVQKAVVEVV